MWSTYLLSLLCIRMALPFTSTVENLYNLVINIQQIPQDCDLNYMKFNSNTLGQEVTSEI